MAYEQVLVALADPTRRRLFEALRAAPRTVGELADGLPVSRPAVSQHLRVLEAADLVDVEPQGTKRVYSMKRDGLLTLRRYLDDLWSEALDSYAAEIERRTGRTKRRT